MLCDVTGHVVCLQRALVQYSWDSGFRGPDPRRPGSQGILALPTITCGDGGRQEDLAIAIISPSTNVTRHKDVIEAQGKIKKIKNIDLRIRSSATGFSSCVATPAPGVGGAALRGVGEALPSGVRTGSWRNEEQDVDYSAAVKPTRPDGVGRDPLCNVPPAGDERGAGESRLGVDHAAESKQEGAGLAGPAKFATNNNNKKPTRSRHRSCRPEKPLTLTMIA